jgi:hypothetical protein
MVVTDCTFYGPGIYPHRTQDRHNMLAGIILQPGAWDKSPGALEDVFISDISMRNVASPVTIFFTRPGNAASDITVSRLTATGVYRAAASVESWTETPVGRVVFRDVSIEYEGGGHEDGPEKAREPGVGARPLPSWGFYAKNVKELRLEDVRLSAAEKDLRPVLMARDVGRLELAGFRYPRLPDAAPPLDFRDVQSTVREWASAGKARTDDDAK